jgi:hypothetical protein
MSEWTVKGVVDDNEEATSTSREQDVLDKAVDEGKVNAEYAGREESEVPKIKIDDSGSIETPAVADTSEEATEEVTEEVTEEAAEAIEDDSPLQLITEEDEAVEPEAIIESVAEPVQEVVPQIELPENVDKLVKFMEETGGTVEDYVLLNRDLSAYDDGSLLKEYYKQSKPWDQTEINEYMEDNFSYDEDDDPRDIRSKKRAFKEELHSAKRFLEGNKEKYYADIKLNKQNDIPQEYQQAFAAQTEYNKNADINQKAAETFLQKTSDVFNQDFKGFDFQVGSDKYRFKVNNAADVKTQQSDINNFVNEFIGEDGQINNAKGYHKALFAARNADKLAEHFYEQGRADALRTSAKEAKNIKMDPRQEGVIKANTGQKFKVVSGESSSKLRMKLRK